MLEVREIENKEALPYILAIHYAKRRPSISYAFGLFEGSILIGVVTYGTPPSASLRIGLLGREMQSKVLELNRLVLVFNRKNEASFLVGRSLKMLPRDKAIVSFADTAQNHLGVVYQACNFLYTGLSAKRTNWTVKGREGLHGQTIADEFRGVPDRAKAIREKYGDDFSLEPRSRKHRYVFLHGSVTQKKHLLKNLRYKVLEYPKLEQGKQNANR